MRGGRIRIAAVLACSAVLTTSAACTSKRKLKASAEVGVYADCPTGEHLATLVQGTEVELLDIDRHKSYPSYRVRLGDGGAGWVCDASHALIEPP